MKSLSIRKFLNFVLATSLVIGLLLAGLPLQEAQAAATGGDGPGGVGSTGGTTTPELWLKADSGTFSDAGCTTTPATTNGDSVACWQDQSGNGNDVSGTTVPTYASSVLNNQPALDFGGTGYLTRDITDADEDFTIFVVATTNSTDLAEYDSLFSITDDPNVSGSFQLDVGGPSIANCDGQFRIVMRDGSNTPSACNGSYPADGSAILAYRWDSSSVSSWNNGSAGGTYTSGTFNPVFDLFKIGVNRNTSTPWPNDIAEEIVYWDALPDVQRILVENYLQAKYNDSTSDNLMIATDVYAGDTTANGDFDLNVAGIGQYGGVQHTEAHAAGLIVVNNTFLQDDGDWLLFGHNVPVNSNTTADLPGGWVSHDHAQRWARDFYIDQTDAPGGTSDTVDIIFDFSEGGMSGTPGDPSNYRLLRRATSHDPFAEVASATATVVGDQVQFLGVHLGDLQHYSITLGTIDATNSPTAVSLQSFSASASTPFLAFLGLFGVVFGGLIIWRRQK